jgi:hypothetical protein
VTAGVDVGRVLHVRISRWLGDRRAAPLYIGEVAGFEDLAQLWSGYNVNFGLVDERPEERAARAFMDAFRGRCMLLRWSGEEQRDPVAVDEEAGLVVARRTGACDRLVSAIAEQRRLLPRNPPKDYVSHLIAPHRVTETTKGGQKVARYISEREDHYFFAEVHDLLAREAKVGKAAQASGPPPPTYRERHSIWR